MSTGMCLSPLQASYLPVLVLEGRNDISCFFLAQQVLSELEFSGGEEVTERLIYYC